MTTGAFTALPTRLRLLSGAARNDLITPNPKLLDQVREVMRLKHYFL